MTKGNGGFGNGSMMNATSGPVGGGFTSQSGFMTKQPNLGFNMHSQHTTGKNHSAPKMMQGSIMAHKSKQSKS
jgi:hypothetical protein